MRITMRGIEKRGDLVYDSDDKTAGKTTGGGYVCPLEGCGQWCIGVRWPDGQLTFPCTGGMFVREDGARQISGSKRGR